MLNRKKMNIRIFRMEKNIRILNVHDIERIRGFLSLATMGGKEKFATLLKLKEDLDTATFCEPESIPNNVVTINSEIRIENMLTHEFSVVKIVFPQDSSGKDGNISLLTPLGAAILGHEVGKVISYNAPGGEIQVKIISMVYQPESQGDYVS